MHSQAAFDRLVEWISRLKPRNLQYLLSYAKNGPMPLKLEETNPMNENPRPKLFRIPKLDFARLDCFNSPKTIRERLLYTCWLAFLTACLALLMIGLIEIVGGMIFQTIPKQFLLGWAIVGFPICIYTRELGKKHCRFLEHENSLDQLGKDYEESFQTKATITRTLLTHLKEIQESEGWERQEKRQVAKQWLLTLPEELEEKDPHSVRLCHKYLGYLIPKYWPKKKEI